MGRHKKDEQGYTIHDGSVKGCSTCELAKAFSNVGQRT